VTLFSLSTFAAWAGTVALAVWLRGRFFATFAGVMLGIHGLISVGLWSTARDAGLGLPFAVAQGLAFVHMASLTRAKLRPVVWRGLISTPAMWFWGGTFMAFPWAIAAALGLPPWGWWVPYALALVGVFQSLRAPRSTVDLTLDGTAADGLARWPLGDGRVERPLRIVQISDPHLGPWMSVDRLRAICERAVADAPDLVLLTGDYLTMESAGTPGCLAEGLAPLQALEGRTFACLGNHDYEALPMVVRELAAVGVKLLVDHSVVVQTEAGPVQIVGADFTWRDREVHMQELCTAHPRVPGALRLMLLHDPAAFAHLPPGEADLVLAGHTHGGQVGLLSLGHDKTVISALSDIPDHGLWARGTDRLYVHRATGFYGFPLRLGVPAEEGVLQVHRVPGTPA